MQQSLCMIHVSCLRELSSPSRKQFCPAYAVTFKIKFILPVNKHSMFLARNRVFGLVLVRLWYTFAISGVVTLLTRNTASPQLRCLAILSKRQRMFTSQKTKERSNVAGF